MNSISIINTFKKISSMFTFFFLTMIGTACFITGVQPMLPQVDKEDQKVSPTWKKIGGGMVMILFGLFIFSFGVMNTLVVFKIKSVRGSVGILNFFNYFNIFNLFNPFF